MKDIKVGDICVITEDLHGSPIGTIVKCEERYTNNVDYYREINSEYDCLYGNIYPKTIRLATHKEKVFRILVLARKDLDLTNTSVYEKEMNINNMKNYNL